MEPREYERMFSLEERHWWYRGLRRQLLLALDRTPPALDRPRRCLDAGCGCGMNLIALRRHLGPGAYCIGCDFSAAALGFAAQRELRDLASASVEQLPYAAGAFDLILSTDVLYHAGVRDDVAALREFSRCLTPGGWLLLNLPAFNALRSAHDAAIHTARRYTRRGLAEKLRTAGLQPVRLHHWNWILFPPLAAFRLLRRGHARTMPDSDLAAQPGWINLMLDHVLAAEAALSHWPTPPGLSIMALARKGGAHD